MRGRPSRPTTPLVHCARRCSHSVLAWCGGRSGVRAAADLLTSGKEVRAASGLDSARREDRIARSTDALPLAPDLSAHASSLAAVRAEGAAPHPFEPVAQQSAGRRRSSTRILVVDDDRELVELLAFA